MTTNAQTRNYSRFAVIGLAALLPAAVLLTSGAMHTLLGPNSVSESMLSVVHPVLVLGGLAIALILNTVPLFRIQFSRDTLEITGTISLQGRLRNALVVTGVCVFLTAISFYLAVENFHILATHSPVT